MIDKYNLVVRVGEASASVTRPNSSVEVCAQLWSFSSIISASELFVDHVEGVEHYSTIRFMVGARLGALNGRVEVKRSISRLFLNVL